MGNQKVSALIFILLEFSHRLCSPKMDQDGMKVPAEKIADLRLPFLKNREKGEEI